MVRTGYAENYSVHSGQEKALQTASTVLMIRTLSLQHRIGSDSHKFTLTAEGTRLEANLLWGYMMVSWGCLQVGAACHGLKVLLFMAALFKVRK